MPGPPRPQHPLDFANRKKYVYIDRKGFQVQPLPQRQFYDEGDQHHDGTTIDGYNNSQTSGDAIAPLQVVVPSMAGSYPMAAAR